MTPSKITVAAVQMVSGTCLATNFKAAAMLIQKAASAGAKLVVLPESFAVFGVNNMYDFAQAEEQPNPPIQTFLAQQAKAHNITLVGGTIARALNGNGKQAKNKKSFAAVHVYSPQGSFIGRYDKAHLFDAGVSDAQGRYCESDVYSPGNSLGLIASDLGNLGVGVCYDLRFPEFFRAMQVQSNNTMNLMALPSAFTHATGQAHWHVLLRARAIETQCAIIAANQGGDHGGNRHTYGHSCIVDAWGKVLAQCPSGEGIAIATIDFNEQAALRQKMPVFSHRKKW